MANIAEIKARREAVIGFEHKHDPDVLWRQNTLAEVGADGKWLTWDMITPFSTAACDFIAHAPADIDALLAHIAALEGERDALVAAVKWSREHAFDIGQIASYPSWLGFFEAEPADIIQALGKRGYEIHERLEAICPEAGASEAEGGEGTQ